ncbi:hypothetical protein M9194_04365 [Vibrio sp. S4M6]|uniref:hypothetical protein n=1 Tax=Vibrio sinus TaxID=2946865 RepID=UPI00202AC0D3|nr:hypothetical protein [Vibrio sinus]MCL9780670.1 hypothetical protein [Vibrio sinus]
MFLDNNRFVKGVTISMLFPLGVTFSAGSFAQTVPYPTSSTFVFPFEGYSDWTQKVDDFKDPNAYALLDAAQVKYAIRVFDNENAKVKDGWSIDLDESKWTGNGVPIYNKDTGNIEYEASSDFNLRHISYLFDVMNKAKSVFNSTFDVTSDNDNVQFKTPDNVTNSELSDAFYLLGVMGYMNNSASINFEQVSRTILGITGSTTWEIESKLFGKISDVVAAAMRLQWGNGEAAAFNAFMGNAVFCGKLFLYGLSVYDSVDKLKGNLSPEERAKIEATLASKSLNVLMGIAKGSLGSGAKLLNKLGVISMETEELDAAVSEFSSIFGGIAGAIGAIASAVIPLAENLVHNHQVVKDSGLYFQKDLDNFNYRNVSSSNGITVDYSAADKVVSSIDLNNYDSYTLGDYYIWGQSRPSHISPSQPDPNQEIQVYNAYVAEKYLVPADFTDQTTLWRNGYLTINPNAKSVDAMILPFHDKTHLILHMIEDATAPSSSWDRGYEAIHRYTYNVSSDSGIKHWDYHQEPFGSGFRPGFNIVDGSIPYQFYPTNVDIKPASMSIEKSPVLVVPSAGSNPGQGVESFIQTQLNNITYKLHTSDQTGTLKYHTQRTILLGKDGGNFELNKDQASDDVQWTFILPSEYTSVSYTDSHFTVKYNTGVSSSISLNGVSENNVRFLYEASPSKGDEENYYVASVVGDSENKHFSISAAYYNETIDSIRSDADSIMGKFSYNGNSQDNALTFTRNGSDEHSFSGYLSTNTALTITSETNRLKPNKSGACSLLVTTLPGSNDHSSLKYVSYDPKNDVGTAGCSMVIADKDLSQVGTDVENTTGPDFNVVVDATHKEINDLEYDFTLKNVSYLAVLSNTDNLTVKYPAGFITNPSSEKEFLDDSIEASDLNRQDGYLHMFVFPTDTYGRDFRYHQAHFIPDGSIE